jgi:demethylmenaquinone methyltransferase/2-methoxy-6-polyprenyl-1,4-benzoquinol methylase
VSNINYSLANAEHLPFANESFDIVSIAFGLRNVTDKQQALHDFYRVLKPGGMLLVLEFSQLENDTIRKIYDEYSFTLLPKMGKFIAGDEESYQYLAESIRKHPNQETLKEMVLTAGFNSCEYHNLSGGIVALHKAIK